MPSNDLTFKSSLWLAALELDGKEARLDVERPMRRTLLWSRKERMEHSLGSWQWSWSTSRMCAREIQGPPDNKPFHLNKESISSSSCAWIHLPYPTVHSHPPLPQGQCPLPIKKSSINSVPSPWPLDGMRHRWASLSSQMVVHWEAHQRKVLGSNPDCLSSL